MRRLRISGLVALSVLAGACEKLPVLLEEFPASTILGLEELGSEARISFTGPDFANSQAISEEARQDEDLFLLIEPRAVRPARTLGGERVFDDMVSPFCPKPCARESHWRNQEMWVLTQICRKGPVATFPSVPVPDDGRERRYSTRGLSLTGRFILPEEVTCYDTFLFFVGAIVCTESCNRCGPRPIDCVFYSASLGYVPTEMPETPPTSQREVDCDELDAVKCEPPLPDPEDDPESPL